jgi:hypothetical protein
MFPSLRPGARLSKQEEGLCFPRPTKWGEGQGEGKQRNSSELSRTTLTANQNLSWRGGRLTGSSSDCLRRTSSVTAQHAAWSEGPQSVFS